MSSRKEQGARIIHKRTSVTGLEPTTPTNDDHTTGWADTDIYEGELYINLEDFRAFTRAGTTNIEFVILDKVTGKINANQLPTSIVGSVIYKGGWDASTGNPPTATPSNGWYYIVTVSGTTNLHGGVGTNSWSIGDWAIYVSGSTVGSAVQWEKIDNTETVIDFSPFLRLTGGTMTGTLQGTDIGVSGNIWISGMTNSVTTSLVYYDISTGKLSYGDSSSLTPIYDSNLGDLITVPTTVGGITAGTTVGSLTGNTFSYLFDALLFPTVAPSISPTNSASLAGVTTSTVEVGTPTIISSTATYTTGTIHNGNGTTGPNLTGDATSYTFKFPNSTSIAPITATSNSEPYVFSSYPVGLGSNNWTVDIAYAAGTDFYYDSKGVASSVLNASRVSGTRTGTSATITGRRYQWNGYGVQNSHPINSAGVRSLPSSQGTRALSASNTGTISISIPATTQEVYFYIPIGKTVLVQYVESSYTDVTGSFTSSAITVNDANGVPQSYEMWFSFVGVTGYPATATYLVTIS